MKDNKRFTYDNIQFESNPTFYLICFVCQEPLNCHVPEKDESKEQDFTVTVIPHKCSGG